MTHDLKEHVRQLTESTAARERMEGELKIAHDIQMGILTREFPECDGVDVHAVLEPARQVGGDLYDVFFVDDRRLGIVIGDVSGKGVPAAVFMSGAKTLIKAIAGAAASPADILSAANRELSANNDYGAFVTVFMGILDLDTKAFVYTCAGHNPPLLLHIDGPPTFVEGGRSLALGIFEDAEFVADRIQFEAGQGLFLYTDGVTEAFNPQRELYGEERLQALLARIQSGSAEEIIAAVLDDVRTYARDTPQSDDITLLVMKLPAGATDTCGPDDSLGGRPVKQRLTMTNDRSEIQVLMREAVAFWERSGAGGETVHDLRLVVEEVLTNIIAHGYGRPGGANITVVLDAEADGFSIEIRDRGRPFDPLTHEPAGLDTPFEKRDIGGMGIHLVRSLVDAIAYRRDSRENILTMKKYRNPRTPYGESVQD